MGFTLVELLISLGIFAFISVAFITILIAVTRVQVQQSSAVEVGTQSQALLQKIQYYVEQSSLIDIPQDTPTSTLKLYTGVDAQDPTYISLQNGTVYLQQTATGTPQALTSNRVTVSDLTFTKRANAPSHDSVSVAFTIAYNTSNIEQAFSQMLQTSIARVSAATFDSNILPSSTATYNLGVAGNIWNSVNQSIYFSGTNVGIGTASPQEALDLNGRLYFEPSSAPATTADRLYNVGGNLYWNGLPWGVSATGTAFYVPYWNAAGTALSASSTLFISSSTGDVGIGTTSPGAALDIHRSDSSYYQALNIQNDATGGGDFTIMPFAGSLANAVAGDVLITNGVGNLIISPNASSKSIEFVGGTWNNPVSMIINSSGNVGIGTTAPGSALTVASGDIDISSASYGLILKDTSTGTCYRVQITSGALATTTVTCP